MIISEKCDALPYVAEINGNNGIIYRADGIINDVLKFNF